jgi:hypothetical protein
MKAKYGVALAAIAVIIAAGFKIATWQSGGSQSSFVFALASIVIGIGGMVIDRPSQALRTPITIALLALIAFGMCWFLLQIRDSNYFSSLQNAYQQADQGE